MRKIGRGSRRAKLLRLKALRSRRKAFNADSLKTNHIQTREMIYCHWVHERDDVKESPVLEFTENHDRKYCSKGCPYFAGNAQGEGIECTFYNGTGEPIVNNPSPYELRAMIDRLNHGAPLKR